jgi:dTDP-4-dehydrorhamnose reductase
VECTINRVRDQYFNQLELSGHWHRESDLERFAELGLRTLRFPILWESIALKSLDEIDWSWPDRRLSKLKALGIRPIVGLLHHGSGPRYTSLLDPEFPEKLARFAGMIARRYPWIDMYTPVNEPLTTARFSGLYGHWYPHARDNAVFARTMLNQCRAIVFAMGAIRSINPGALLIQTEDLGRTFSTRAMRYQADFDNERRWLTWDLLLGRVKPGCRMWDWLSWVGVPAVDLHFFAEPRCRIDVLGINHYVTSDRYLDENVDMYPAELRGHNDRQVYADDAAVRSRSMVTGGVRTAIAEAHNRYRLPIALTEVHLGCSVDEQMRWFYEAWQAAEIMRERGVAVRAVTAWALLGSFNWDSLVTRDDGHYESGAFELRHGHPHSTLLADMLSALARDNSFCAAVLQSKGWWRKRSRLRHRIKDDLAA